MRERTGGAVEACGGRTVSGLAVGMVVGLVLGASAAPARAAPAAPPSMRDVPMQAPNVALRDTVWTLTSLNGTAVVADRAGVSTPLALVLRARDQQIGGHTGCAALGGRYVQQGTRIALNVRAEPLAAPAQGSRCDSTRSARAQRYADTLAAAVSYRVEGRVLSLLRNDRVIATFAAGARSKR